MEYLLSAPEAFLHLNKTMDLRSGMSEEIENDIFREIRQAEEQPADGSKVFIFLMVTLGVGVCFKMVCNALKGPFLYYPSILLTGFFFGLILYHQPDFRTRASPYLAKLDANTYVLIFLPAIVFHTAFEMDYHGFGHSTLQALVIGIAVFPFEAIILGVIFYYYSIFNEEPQWGVAMIFAIICCTIESEIVIQELNKTIARVKHLQLLLQAEQLASLATAFYCYTVTYLYYHGDYTTWLFIFLYIVWHLLGALSGFAVGFISGYIFIKISNDMRVAVTLTMVAAFVSFYIGDYHIYQSGAAATIVTGVLLSPTRMKTSSDVENHITNFWDGFTFICTTVAFAIPGVIVGLSPYFIGIRDVIFVVMVYILCVCARFILFFAARPILIRVGHNLTWTNMAIVVIGPYKGAPALVIAMLYKQNREFLGLQVLTYTAILCLLSSVLNGFFLPLLLKILGLFDLTKARAVNMRNAIANVQECRNKAILSLKMDRVVADANWIIVEESSRMANPTLKTSKDRGSDLDTAEMMFEEPHRAVCPDCELETVVLPTKKELMDLEIEAKHRILKAKLVSLWRQFETGTLSKSSMNVLSTLLQNTMEKADPRLDINELELYWSPPKCIQKIKLFFEYVLRNLPQKYDLVSKGRIRTRLFKILNSLSYKIITAILILIDTYFIVNLAFAEIWPKVININPYVLQGFDIFFYLIFLAEFIILISVLGVHQYFKRQLNKVDFICNVIIRTAGIILILRMGFEWTNYMEKYLRDGNQFIIDITKLLLFLRLNRLYIVVEVALWKLLNLLEYRLDNTLVQYYEIGKAFLVANDRTLKYLRHIVHDATIYRKLRTELEEDRKRVAKSIGIIQKERPNVAVTIKTRHAIKQVINEMNDCINDIFDEGLLDDIEKKYLKGSLDKSRKLLRSLKVIAPCSPQYILKDVPWLFEETEIAEFLLKHARLVSFSYQDIIIEAGDDPTGIFVLVSGLVKCVYTPSRTTLENCRKHGALPNCDFLVSLKLEESQEDYIVSGNVIGEIGAVTGRRFDMTVMCESAVQVYYIPSLCVYKVLNEMENCMRVACKVWKSIGIRIALILLQYVPNFQGWLKEKTLLYLEKSFVPILHGVEELFINELVSDVVLIEGMVMDGNTRSIFYAPFYIPRTTNKLILPGSGKWSINPKYQTRLLIIPTKHSDQMDIMGEGGIIKNIGDKTSGTIHTHLRESFDLPAVTRKGAVLRPMKKSHQLTVGEFHNYVTQIVQGKKVQEPHISTDTFSTDSDISRFKIFQKHLKAAVGNQPYLRSRKKKYCIEDVAEQSDGGMDEVEEVTDSEHYKKLLRKKIKRKYMKRKQYEQDIKTQTILTSAKIYTEDTYQK